MLAAVTAGFTAVYAQESTELGNLSLLFGGYFLAICIVAHIYLRMRLPNADPYLFPLVALLTAFGVHAQRQPDQALIDLRLFTHRPFVTSVGVIFGYSVAMFGTLLLIPLYEQVVRGGGPLEAGLLVAPFGAGAIVTMTLAGRITGRYGTRGPSLAGLLAVLAGLVAYTQVTDWPVLDGLSGEVTAVEVLAADAVVMFRVQPPEMLPASGQASSTTYRLHVPFGSIPLNAARVVFPDAAGAGAGKTSGPLNSA